MKKNLKSIRAYTFVEIVIVVLLIALLSSCAFMLSREGTNSSNQMIIEQNLSSLSSSFMRILRKDIRSSTAINIDDQKLMLTVNSFTKSNVLSKENVVYTWKNAVISRKTISKSTNYDFSSIMGKGASFTFNITLNKKEASTSIIIDIISATGKLLLKINETV